MYRHDSTISAICYTLVQDRSGLGAVLDGTANAVVVFAQNQLQEKPDYLKLPVTLVFLLLDCKSLLLHGGRFRTLENSFRSQLLASWRASILAPLRDFVRLFDALVVYGLAESWMFNTCAESK